MRNLQELPITSEEVIGFLNHNAEMEVMIGDMMKDLDNYQCDDLLAKTALAVVRAASTIVQNDIGSPAAELLGKAFDSQNSIEHRPV